MSSVSPPPAQHKLQACISRLTHHLERTRHYLDLLVPVLPEDEEDSNRQFFFQTIILMIHTFMEEYFRCIVSLGTFWFAPDVRAYMAAQYPARAQSYQEMPAGLLSRDVARREVSFGRKFEKLKGILHVLTTTGPFTDAWAETLCLDLVAVRNIITHQGGWAEKSNVPTVTSPHVIVLDASIGSAEFYRLKIGKQFVVDVLSALVLSSLSMETALRNDPRYRL